MRKNGNGNWQSTGIRDNGTGNGYFFKSAKISIGQLDANAI